MWESFLHTQNEGFNHQIGQILVHILNPECLKPPADNEFIKEGVKKKVLLQKMTMGDMGGQGS